MKLVTRTLAALAAIAACTPLGPAYGETPLWCFGDPDGPPAGFVCFVRFQIGLDTPPDSTTITIPGFSVTTPQSVQVAPQTHTVPETFVGVPERDVAIPPTTVTVPQVCAIFCVGPFSQTITGPTVHIPALGVSIPETTINTPGLDQPLPWTTVTVPTINQTIDFIGLALPPESIAVVYYSHFCYYINPNGTITFAHAESQSTCP